MKQSFTSANTSINKVKVPAVYGNKTAQKTMRGKRVIDIGGGKYDTAIKAAKAFDASVSIYDPYNRTPEHNKPVLSADYDVAVISNVLNVIKEKECRNETLRLAATKAKTILVTVYEGNKSGIGKQSKKDCWQENRKLETYIDEVKQATGYNVERCGSVIVARG